MDCGNHCAVELESTQKFGHIDTLGLANLISSEVSFVIFDARGGQWDDGKRIAHANNLSLEATEEQVAELIPNKQTLIVVYCSNVQCPASNYLAKHLLTLGYSNLLKYDQGIQEWMNAGHPIRETR